MKHFNNKDEIKNQPFRQRKSPKSKLVRKEGKTNEKAIKGIIVASIGKVNIVESVINSNKMTKGELFECFPAGSLISPHETSSLITVGDVVNIIPEEKKSVNNKLRTGKIIKIEERGTMLSRIAAGPVPFEHIIASNIESVVIFMSYTNPEYNRRLIDRIMISSEMGGVEPCICINKIDLAEETKFRQDLRVYRKLGLRVFFISAIHNKGISGLRRYLVNRSTVFIGPSGAGKSTLLNNLIGSEVQKISEVSEKTFKGKHTTSYVRMFNYGKKGKLIDTPGIREFGIWGLDKDEAALFYHEFDGYLDKCRYPKCTHTHEPDCAVINAVESGELDFDRYESYINLYESIIK